MKKVDDPWFIRLPNGKVMRARTTRALLRHLEQGSIPLDSMVRRFEEDEWIGLEWTEEFQEVVSLLQSRNHSPASRIAPQGPTKLLPSFSSGASVSSRLDSQILQTVGVDSWIKELLAALDSVLVSKKLLTAALGSLFLGLVLALSRSGFVNLEALGYGFSATVTATAFLFVYSCSSALLLQLTYVEVTALRPALWREGLKGLINQTCRLVLGFVLMLGGLLVIVGVLFGLTIWLLASDPSPWGARHLGAIAAGVTCVFACLALMPLFSLSLLLGPILITEQCSVWKAMHVWGNVLRRNLWRVLAYEILALSIGLVVTLPFAVPVALVYFLPLDERLSIAKNITCDMLAGLATAPILAYLTVANMFIYLNMHYGTSEAQRGIRPR